MTTHKKLPPLPRCAICDKTVDEIRIDEDPARGLWLVTVSCHGDTDSRTMDPREYFAGHVSAGTAFDQQRIAARK